MFEMHLVDMTVSYTLRELEHYVKFHVGIQELEFGTEYQKRWKLMPE